MSQINENSRLITVTREDLTAGYQTAQTGHSIAKFAYDYPEIFKEWYEKSSYLICLAVKNEEELIKLRNSLKNKEIKYSKFYEPDVDEITSIAIEPSEIADKLTSNLPTANKNSGKIKKKQNKEKTK